MSKKILIPLIILAVVLAAGLGIFIASNQSAQPASTTATAPRTELKITEIDRTITVPADLGKTSYQATTPTTLVFYSDKYENMTGCAGHPLAELRLSNTQTDNALPVGGEYTFATFVAQPMGACGEDDGVRLAGTLLTALSDAR